MKHPLVKRFNEIRSGKLPSDIPQYDLYLVILERERKFKESQVKRNSIESIEKRCEERIFKNEIEKMIRRTTNQIL